MDEMEDGEVCFHCEQSGGAGQGCCDVCGFPMDVYQRLVMDPDGVRGDVARKPIEFQNAGAVIRIDGNDIVIIGRGDSPFDGADVQSFRHRGLEERHVAFVCDPDESIWLFDLVPQRSSVFVDGQRVSIVKLSDGAVVQIGPLAWRLNIVQRVLSPVAPIGGFDLQVDAEVAGRLTRTQLTIHRGEMTAIVGPSGCGKSTLLETIRDGSGLTGQVETAGRVFFVPQRDLVHHDLRIGDALRAIGRLYRSDVLPFEIDSALDSVGLPLSVRDKFPGQLSGGQLRRFRIAGALLSGAGVIVLDEPDSGLDHETADEVIALLHSLAVRGATIVAVTHHRHVLQYFDRVITMRSTDQGGDVDEGWLSERQGETSLSNEDAEIGQDGVVSGAIGLIRRFPILLRRERQKLASPKLGRLSLGPIQVPHFVVGMLLVPLLFAMAVAISVPTDPNLDVADGLYGKMAPIVRLGFLSIVSVVWMSASGSHLSITRDRELYDYERSYGLTWGGILSAKSMVLAIAGIIQTLVFAGLLFLIRDLWLARSFFVGEHASQLPQVVICLLLVSVAATMLGLLISAIAGRVPVVATAILPVVMMFQILFSAPFAVSNPDGYEPLADYDQLTVFATEPDTVGHEVDEDDWEDDVEQARPLWATSLFSYATLSRYGDKWLRSFAVTIDPPEQSSAVKWASAAALALISGLCFLGAWFVLWVQSARLGVRRIAVPKTVAVTIVLVAAIIGGPSVAAESPQGKAEDKPTTTIRLPLVDGRYDENKLRQAFGGHAGSQPRWREFSNQDRIGLVALELVGKIEFTLDDRELTITPKELPKWELMKHLAPARLVGAESAAGHSDVVLFVHGLEGGASTFAAAERDLKSRGIASMRFDFPNDGPPREIGRLLADRLTEFGENNQGTRVHLIAHSLGGLISTWAVTENGFPSGMVPNIFTLGAPFRGSVLAAFHDELEIFDVLYRLGTGVPNALNTVSDGRGEAAKALSPGSDFLRELRVRPRPAGVRFHLAAGTKSFLSGERRDRLAAKLPGELARLAISKAYARRIDQLLAADELRDGLGDGAVTVASALGLPNPASSTTFPLTHTAMVSSVQPLEWALDLSGLTEPVNPKAK